MPSISSRGPLRAIILAETGQDVRLCEKCCSCEDSNDLQIDMSFREILRAAARNDERALQNQTLWASKTIFSNGFQCQSGLDLPAVMQCLQAEAQKRGFPNPGQDKSRIDQ